MQHFRRIYHGNFPPEAVREVISGMAVQDVGMDVCANFGDSMLKQSDCQRRHFRPFLNADYFRREEVVMQYLM